MQKMAPIDYGPGVHFLWVSIFYETYRKRTPTDHGTHQGQHSMGDHIV